MSALGNRCTIGLSPRFADSCRAPCTIIRGSAQRDKGGG